MPLSQEQLDAFDSDDDFSARLAKIDYILENGTEQEINQYLNRAMQEASLQYLMELAKQVTPGDLVELGIPGTETGVVVLTNSGGVYGITIEGRDTNNERFTRNFVYTPVHDSDPIEFWEVRAELNTVNRHMERYLQNSQNQELGERAAMYGNMANRSQRVLDMLSLPLFQDVELPQQQEQLPQTPEGSTDAPQP